jgi:hypothetical protein
VQPPWPQLGSPGVRDPENRRLRPVLDDVRALTNKATRLLFSVLDGPHQIPADVAQGIRDWEQQHYGFGWIRWLRFAIPPQHHHRYENYPQVAVTALRELRDWLERPQQKVADPDQENSIRLVGEVWHLRYFREKADFPVRGNKFLDWLARLLEKPNHAWTVAELLGDPDDKLKADALLGGERVMDEKGLRAIRKRIEEIDDITQETGGSEQLENEKAKLLRPVGIHPERERVEAAVSKSYNNVTTQERQFLQKLEAMMPQLAAHLKACIQPSGNDNTISYQPPVATEPWIVENPSA